MRQKRETKDLARVEPGATIPSAGSTASSDGGSSTVRQVCENCGKHPATHLWCEGGLAYVHGMRTRWCEVCVLEAQIDYAKKAADRLPALKDRLIELLLAQPPSVGAVDPHADSTGKPPTRA